MAAPAQAAWKFTPTLDLRETYSDNIALATDARKEGGFVTEVTPGFTLVNNSRRVKASASYQLHYYAYDDKGMEGARHTQSRLNSTLSSIVVDDLLFFDASGTISQEPISPFGPGTNYSGFAIANSAIVKTWIVSPYLRHSFGATATAQLRYTRDSVDSGSDSLFSSHGDNLVFNLNSGPLFRRVGWGVFANYQRLNNQFNDDTAVKTGGVNLRYMLNDSFSLTASGGYDAYDYQTVGESIKGKNWSAGFDWTPSRRSHVRFNAGKRYFGDSYFLDAMHRSRKSVWNLNYNDAVTTTRDQFLLPATIDTAAVLDRLFAPDIADPVARRQAVDAYMRATGLPTSLAESVNYFSNRYILQRRLQLSGAFNTARTTTVLSLHKTRREALSTLQTDGTVTGPNRATINDDTTQTGATASFNMRLTGRSSANVSLTNGVSESNSAALKTRFTAFRMGMTRIFTPRMSASTELRHIRGSQLDAAEGYKENAISASLSLKL